MSRVLVDIIIPILDALLISHISPDAPEMGRVNPEERMVIKTYLKLEDEDQLQTFSPFLWTILSSGLEGFDIWYPSLWVNT